MVYYDLYIGKIIYLTETKEPLLHLWKIKRLKTKLQI